MNYLTEALAWIADPANQSGPNGILARLAEHLLYTLIATGGAALLAIPIGYAIGHTGRGSGLVVGATGAARALPTLGVLTLIALLAGIGIGAPLIALGVLAAPSILAGAYSGVQAVEPSTVDAARAIGMSEWQVLWRVEIPLGLPQLIGGLRSAVLQVMATATLVAYVGGGGLGRFLFLGLKTQDYPQMLAASLLVVALAVVCEGLFEVSVRVSLARKAARSRSPQLIGG
ncbi:MAG: ABC transporter permease [Acidobacteriota bacterium]|nr:ABC transporter permease [Acidobacteriota bacterium]NLH68656.1 ABC transporter permease [Brooklawnia sp.]